MAVVFGPSNQQMVIEDLDIDPSKVIRDVAWTVGDVAGVIAERNGGTCTAEEVEEALAALRGGKALEEQQVQDGWDTLMALV